MGNKNRQKKNRTQSENQTKSSKLAPIIMVALSVAILTTVYFLTKPQMSGNPIAPAFGQLIEQRPVLSSAMFAGKAGQAYKIAAEIPKILDSLFCYCYCKKEHNHKNLLTCFTNNHGSKCDICINEVLYAYELYKKGKTLDEIVIDVDKRFYRPYTPHRI
jgi:hypothetical protein